MTKTFNVGDRVRCIAPTYSGYSHVDRNQLRRGEEFTVTGVRRDGGTFALTVKRDDGSVASGWYARRFELVKAATPAVKKLTLTDVAVGDTVVLLPPSRSMNAKAGATACVTAKDHHNGWLRLEWDRSNALSGQQADGHYPVSDFEIVPKANPDLLIDLSKLKVGDRITVTQVVEVTQANPLGGTVFTKTVSGAPVSGCLTPGTKYAYAAFTPALKPDLKVGDKVTGKHSGKTGTIRCIAAERAFVEWDNGTAGSPPLANLLAA
ncbi:hypothetical protein [Caulobacter sp.]|uniref:hypothetical protein n=1 Tax=Caulobacter sp. TaxID=78 RepID=UPI0031E27C01